MTVAARHRIYRNLHDQSWTVQHKPGGDVKGWRKLEGMQAVYVPGCSFRVYDSGRQRAREEQRKNVHAFALADRYYAVEHVAQLVDAMPHSITYTPFDDRGFRVLGGADNVTSATGCLFAPSGRIYAYQVHATKPATGWHQPKLEEALGVIRVTVPRMVAITHW